MPESSKKSIATGDSFNHWILDCAGMTEKKSDPARNDRFLFVIPRECEES